MLKSITLAASCMLAAAGHHNHEDDHDDHHHGHDSKHMEMMQHTLIVENFGMEGCDGTPINTLYVKSCDQNAYSSNSYYARNSAYAQGYGFHHSFQETEQVNCHDICAKSNERDHDHDDHHGKHHGKHHDDDHHDHDDDDRRRRLHHHHGDHHGHKLATTYSTGVCLNSTASAEVSSMKYRCKIAPNPYAMWAKHFYCVLKMAYMVMLAIYIVGLGFVLKCIAPRQGFSSPLHGCFSDLYSTLLTLCCPCVTWGKVAHAVHPTNHWAIMSILYMCCHNFACCLGLWNRNELRKSRDIEGNLAQDCMVHTFAHPCALCQEYRETHDGCARTVMPSSEVVAAYRPTVQTMNPVTTVTVTCPEGVKAGQTISVTAPQIGLAKVEIPAGAEAGKAFTAPIIQAQPITLTATVISIQK